MIHLKNLLSSFKAIHGVSPLYLFDLLELNRLTWQVPSASLNLMTVPFYNLQTYFPLKRLTINLFIASTFFKLQLKKKQLYWHNVFCRVINKASSNHVVVGLPFNDEINVLWLLEITWNTSRLKKKTIWQHVSIYVCHGLVAYRRLSTAQIERLAVLAQLVRALDYRWTLHV